jgi:hypothetical protein
MMFMLPTVEQSAGKTKIGHSQRTPDQQRVGALNPLHDKDLRSAPTL